MSPGESPVSVRLAPFTIDAILGWPTTNVTVTLIDSGTASTDCTTSVAECSPLAWPAPAAERFTVAGPVPDSGHATSQLVVRFEGKTEIVHCNPGLTLTLNLPDVDCAGLGTESTISPLFGSTDVESVPGFAAGPINKADCVATICLPPSSMPSIS